MRAARVAAAAVFAALARLGHARRLATDVEAVGCETLPSPVGGSRNGHGRGAPRVPDGRPRRDAALDHHPRVVTGRLAGGCVNLGNVSRLRLPRLRADDPVCRGTLQLFRAMCRGGDAVAGDVGAVARGNRSEDAVCSICLEAPVNATSTACGHHFCRECLRQWLQRAPSCPACRQLLVEVPWSSRAWRRAARALQRVLGRYATVAQAVLWTGHGFLSIAEIFTAIIGPLQEHFPTVVLAHCAVIPPLLLLLEECEDGPRRAPVAAGG